MIYVATHKDADLVVPENYTIIGVGNNYIKNENIHDNVYDNISYKNENYCELTALYWIWKNADEKIVGLNHYRRLFTEDDRNSVELLRYDDACKILDEYDIILPPLFDNKNETVYEHYCRAHKKEDIDKIANIILKIFPNFFNSYAHIMNQNFEYGFNMFISRKEICDEYSKWLFSLLSELEPQVDLTLYDNYQKRIFGFLSERLFTVWVYHYKLRIKELYITNPLNDKNESRHKKLIKSNRKKIKLY